MTSGRTYGQWWAHDEEHVEVTLDSVRALGLAAYATAGAGPAEAEFLLGMNLDKALQGDHARGLGRLPGIVEAARSGKLDLTSTPGIVRETPGFALVDGGPMVSGRLACRFGMDLAIQKARGAGIALVGVRSQAELLTPFLQMATDADMIGVVFNQSFPTVAPTGGAGPLLGNQPLAIGVPANRHPPVLMDMAMTQSSAAGMFLAAAQGQQVAPGLLLDEHGEATTEARDFPTAQAFPGLGFGARGSLTPLGGGHKGYAMIFMLSLLSAVLTDTSPPWELFYDLPERGRYGTVLIAIDPSVVMPIDLFKAKVDGFIDQVKASKRREGVDEILYPGEGSQRLRAERASAGSLPIPRSHYDALCQLAEAIGASPPQQASG